MIRKCCVCQKFMGHKPPYSSNEVSHTFCNQCYGDKIGTEDNQYYLCYLCQDSHHIDDLVDGLCVTCRSGVKPYKMEGR